MPVSLFGMVPITTAQQRFTCVDPILQPQLPTAVRLAVATFPRGSAARPSGGGYSVPSASHPRVTPNARPGRVPVAEHRIFVSLISTRATSCRTSPVGVGASVLPQWRGAIVPKPAEATCRAHPTRRQAIRAGGGAARAAAKRRPRGEAVPGAGRTGVRKSVAKERVRAAAGAPARNHERHATRRSTNAGGGGPAASDCPVSRRFRRV